MTLLVLAVLAVTPREQYESLLKEHDAPRRVTLAHAENTKAACLLFLGLARTHPDDPAALDSLRWVVNHSLFTPEAETAIALLTRDHSRSKQAGAICGELDTLYGGRFKPLNDFFRATLKNNPDREARGRACFALARRLKRDKKDVEQARLQHELFLSGHAVPYTPKPEESDADLAWLRAEAASLFQRVIDEFADIKGEVAAEFAGGNGKIITLGEKARAEFKDL